MSVALDSHEPARRTDEDLFRLLVDRVSDYAIFVLDPRGIVSSWNTGAQRIKGYNADEIVGHHFSRFYPEEAIRAGWPQTELQLAIREGRFEDEGWRVRKDGTRFWANVVITALYDNGELRGFAKVTRDLSDRRRLEVLEADARQLTEFIAMLAHELRNPLAPILSAVAVAQANRDNVERLNWAMDVIGRQAGHLRHMVDDLLDVGRVTRGQVQLERKRLALRQVVEAAVEASRPSCEARQHRLTVDFKADPLVRGDRVRLTQVLCNLINNACKYTPAGGQIAVTLDELEGKARIAVADSGIGIRPELLPRVFDLFVQDRKGLDRAEGGLGLGLSIARRLAELHGGTVVAHSAGPGCGSVFTIELPRLPGAGEGDTPPLRAVVVDDNVDAAITLQALLQMSGLEVHVAHDGNSGLHMIRELQPDVALLDVGMPGMNGYELARAIRQLPELRGLVLVAVTGYATQADRERAFDAGFDQHLAKPIDHDALLRAMPMIAEAANS